MSSSQPSRPWPMARQLALAFGVVLVLLAAVAGLSGWMLRGTLADMRSLYVDRVEPLEQLGAVRFLAARDRVLMMDAILRAQPENTARRLQEFNANRESSARQWKAYMGTYLTDEEKGLARTAEAAMATFVDGALQPTARALAAGNYGEARTQLDTRISPLNPAFSKALDELLELQVRVAKEDYTRSSSHGQRAMVALGALALTALLLGAGGAWLFSRRLLRRLGAEPADLAAVAHRVALGDLADQGRERAPAHSVMASLLAMRQALASIVGTVRSGVEQVASASAQIAQGNGDLSVRTEEQAASLEQTAAAMEQLTSTVRASADNAQQACQLASAASDVAARGGDAVTQVVNTMQDIQGSSRKIADITGVIDSIAFQTNILALNAAVEAARAGEQGRGFAVVAGEVRLLAQRSAEAAREIKGLIGESVGRIEHGGSLVSDAGRTMQDIVTQVQRVNVLIGEITTAAHEQTQGITQVGDAVGQLDQGTQRNAALVEESGAAAESLKQQAQRLSDAVAVFRLA